MGEPGASPRAGVALHRSVLSGQALKGRHGRARGIAPGGQRFRLAFFHRALNSAPIARPGIG